MLVVCKQGTYPLLKPTFHETEPNGTLHDSLKGTPICIIPISSYVTRNLPRSAFEMYFFLTKRRTCVFVMRVSVRSLLRLKCNIQQSGWIFTYDK
jgi:hypothetical protein